MRTVLDANVVVSGLIKAIIPPARILTAWRRGVFHLVSSRPLIAELRVVLARDYIAAMTRMGPSQQDEFIQHVIESAIVVEPTVQLDVVRDPADNRILEAAVAGEADYIVTGDKDLLILSEYKGIRIVRPAGFLAMSRERFGDDVA